LDIIISSFKQYIEVKFGIYYVDRDCPAEVSG
jgi:hypothetical protein